MEQKEQSNYSCKKTVRFKPAELEQLESYFKSTTSRKLSDYIRRVLLKKPVVVKYRNQSADEFLSEMILLKKELNAIGNNFNQAVKKLHTLDDIPEFKAWIIQNEASKETLFAKIGEIQIRMNQLYELWVVKITSPHSIRRALNYNEKKVQRGIAECIHAGNFLKELSDMNFYHKMERFQNQIELNQRAKTNALHISLNFDPSEKLSKEKLTAIADDYMEKIGFGTQPYLIYMHNDAGHPHIHILTTNIQMDGRRIDTFNIGRNQSERARLELELKYELVKAKGRQHKKELFQEKTLTQKLNYGKSDLKRSITNVLDSVLTQYKYTSLAELNALLRQYNIAADRGLENSRTFKNQGLYFRALDKNGIKIGVPIKASSIYSKPTLKNLEIKFAENELRRMPDLQKLRTAIDWTLVKPKKGLEEFIRALEKERVTVVVRRNEKGLVYGLTYIDHNTKSIFNGSDLGKEYSAKRILERCGLVLEFPQQVKERKPEQISVQTTPKETAHSFEHEHKPELSKTLEILLNPSTDYEGIPYELRQHQKKKKQKQRYRHL